MSVPNVNESDWKLFRAKLPGWQEVFMEHLNQEYTALLAGAGKASEKFWALEKRIREDQKLIGVVARMSRSNMYHNLLGLLLEGVITLEDLNDFSEDLREKMAFVTRN